jgi:hypothetical protein
VEKCAATVAVAGSEDNLLVADRPACQQLRIRTISAAIIASTDCQRVPAAYDHCSLGQRVQPTATREAMGVPGFDVPHRLLAAQSIGAGGWLVAGALRNVLRFVCEACRASWHDTSTVTYSYGRAQLR